MDKSCRILSLDNLKVPLFQNAKDLFTFLEPLILPVTKTLALNFAFPLIPKFENGKLDGILLRGTKGHAFIGLENKKIGNEIENYFLEKRSQRIQVSCANDTICLLLSGLQTTPAETLGAGIVGSGMNFAFFKNPKTAINLESADFHKFLPSETGKEIDAESTNPGKSLYEKEVAGVYLFKHYNKKVKKQNSKFTQISDTSEMDFLARGGDKIAIELLHRSAKLIACQIAAIMDFKKTDMTFVMEGSVFWKGFEYKKTVEETCTQMSSHKPKFIHIQNSSVIGASYLVI